MHTEKGKGMKGKSFMFFLPWSILLLSLSWYKESNKENSRLNLLLRRFGRANAHEQSVICNYTTYRTDSLNHPASCYLKHRKALSFSFTFFKNDIDLQ